MKVPSKQTVEFSSQEETAYVLRFSYDVERGGHTLWHWCGGYIAGAKTHCIALAVIATIRDGCQVENFDEEYAKLAKLGYTFSGKSVWGDERKTGKGTPVEWPYEHFLQLPWTEEVIEQFLRLGHYIYSGDDNIIKLHVDCTNEDRDRLLKNRTMVTLWPKPVEV